MVSLEDDLAGEAEKLLKVDPVRKMVIHTYSGFMTEALFKAVSDIGLGKSTGRGYTKHLIDLRDMGAVPRKNTDWIEQDWFPRAVAAGLKTIAYLVPKSAFGQMALKRANNEAEQGQAITMGYFESLEEAHNWLANQPD